MKRQKKNDISREIENELQNFAHFRKSIFFQAIAHFGAWYSSTCASWDRRPSLGFTEENALDA